jgi:hypothetical protein
MEQFGCGILFTILENLSYHEVVLFERVSKRILLTMQNGDWFF